MPDYRLLYALVPLNGREPAPVAEIIDLHLHRPPLHREPGDGAVEQEHAAARAVNRQLVAARRQCDPGSRVGVRTVPEGIDRPRPTGRADLERAWNARGRVENLDLRVAHRNGRGRQRRQGDGAVAARTVEAVGKGPEAERQPSVSRDRDGAKRGHMAEMPAEPHGRYQANASGGEAQRPHSA